MLQPSVLMMITQIKRRRLIDVRPVRFEHAPRMTGQYDVPVSSEVVVGPPLQVVGHVRQNQMAFVCAEGRQNIRSLGRHGRENFLA